MKLFRATRKIKIQNMKETTLDLHEISLDMRPLDIHVNLADFLVRDFKEYRLPMS